MTAHGRGFWRRFVLLMIMAAALTTVLTACQSATSQRMAPDDVLVVGTYVNGQGKTGIKGSVIIKDDGSPLSGGFVNVYPDTTSNLLGPSQFISAPTAADGSYQLEVPAGTYYIVARKRLSGQSTGPLSPGDFYSEHQRIKAEVKAGRLVMVELSVAIMKAPMFFKSRVVDQQTETGFKGVLLDSAGQPVMGGFAMAYSDPEMKRLPDFASTLSDEQGRFTVYLPEGGSYYLAARIHAWDMPTPGEPYGKYGGDAPEAVKVATGRFVENLKIKMEPFAGPYQPGKSQRPF
ncbi:MAG: hypothetical protein OET90_00690 [Desulfuromonadales bacterium]|nr:hypothetical protein [Desulfuromonadales bacterium]